MINNKVLAQSITEKIDFEPMDDRLLVKPMKPAMVNKLVPTAPRQDFGSVDEAEKSEPTEPQKQRVLANIQKGIVIKVGPDYTDEDVPEKLRNIAVGDIVYYPLYAGISFELLKDAKLFRRYEIIGKAKAA